MTKPEFNDDHELDRGRDHELTILSKEDKTEIFHTRDYIRLIRYLIRDMHRNEDLNTTIGNIDKVNSSSKFPFRTFFSISPRKLHSSFEFKFPQKFTFSLAPKNHPQGQAQSEPSKSTSK